MSSASEVYGNLIAAFNARDWDAVGALHADTVIVNGEKQPKQQLVDAISGVSSLSPDVTSNTDVIVSEADGEVVFARCIHRLTLTQPAFGFEPRREPVEFLEHGFFQVESGNITAINMITEMDGFTGIKNLDQGVLKVQSLEVKPAPDGLDIKASYEAFVASLNNRSVQQKDIAARFFCDTIMHNGIDKSLDESLGFLKGAAAIIENQRFTLKDVIIDTVKQQIATRAIITGTPRKPIQGIEPTGKSVEFPAHVFYQLDGGKIRQIYNLWDMKAYRSSLED